MSFLLKAANLKKYYPVGRFFLKKLMLRAVDGVNLEINSGRIFALVGESGSGKTTLGKLLLRLIEPTSGSIFFDGTDITKLSSDKFKKVRRNMAMIFQNPFDSLNPRKTVFQIMRRPFELYKNKRTKFDIKAEVEKVLNMCGLSPAADFFDRYPHELSAGQRQRVVIARAVAVQPKFIVADEPTSQLDVSVQAQILNLLKELQEKLHVSMLFITHDLAIVRSIANDVSIMYLGKIVEVAEVTRLFMQPLHPYTQALLSATPIPNPRVARSRKRFLVVGEPPSPINPPKGCYFNDRCPYRMAKCMDVQPELNQIADNHSVACHLYK